jgi:hypothetical protein
MKYHAMLIVLLGALAGCVTHVNGVKQPSAIAQLAPSLHEQGQLAAAFIKDTFAGESGPSAVQPTWACALPQGCQRGDLLDVTARSIVVAQVLPGLAPEGIQQASLDDSSRLRIRSIDGQRVGNFAEFHREVARVIDDPEIVRASFEHEQIGAPQQADMTPADLLSLYQITAPDQQLVSVVEEGNPWIVLRDGAARCRVMARVERERGLLHLLVATKLCWGPPQLMPTEITAQCDAQPLECLSVSQCLEVLYGDETSRVNALNEASRSFAEASERPEFLVPSNFNTLDLRMQQLGRKSTSPPPLPAFGAPGVTYPGSAVLGDARALSMFLARRSIAHAEDPEQVGWLVFHHAALKTGRNIAVEIDLAHGPKTIEFKMP